MIATKRDDQMPREKIKLYGAKNLTDVELMAVILKTGTKDKNVFQLSEEVMNKILSDPYPLEITVEELENFKGIGLSKATSLIAGIEIGKRLQMRFARQNIKLNSPELVFEYVRHEIASKDKECFCAIYFTAKNHVLSFEIISQGTLTQSLVHPREVFKNAIKKSAHSIIFVHNHPSGDTTPSQEDLMITKRLVKSGDILGIKVLDHLIIANDHYTSLKEQYYME